ncbi:hypothetical protein [Candidatus Synechococcus spongiarum]|uniref:Uncharacterized protein n=1 Tax=Candidatus Synechococcus spongiarum TaxID=431041 RepID=A0A171DGJ6_9SYNE|nr:hypothetical protein [Candidatus Synechococcus spongiarum]SAY38833.1 hypothetical protein FLM9_869 [Candidatus Synechococcus spongiarum]
MPTIPPEKASQRATTAGRGGPSGKTSGGKNRKSWWRSPWIPLGHLVAGLALSLGFHVTFRLWDQTKTYEPLDLSPPFAAKPLPGTSLDSLMRRYGSQLSPLLNPTPPPDRPVPPPLVLTTDRPANGPAPAVTQTTAERRDDGPALNQPTPAPPPPLRSGATQLSVP